MELLARVYRAIKRNLLLFTVLPVTGVIFTLSLAYNSSDKFSSSMMITTDLLSEQEAKFIFDELEKADSIPGLSSEERKKLLGLNFEVAQGEQNDKSKRVYLKVTAIVTDPTIFPSLEKTVVLYINSVDPVVRSRKDQELFYKQMIAKIDNEIAAMDQVKQKTDAMASYVDPSELYAKTVELFRIRTESEIKLKNINTVHVAKGFGSLIKDARLSKMLAAAIGLALGFVIAILLLFIKFFNDYNRALKIE
jgi:tetrahydromethanopterin S-methyltransferase subunit F